MRLASHPHWLIHVQIIKDCNLIFTCFQCWSSSCFLSSSCLHFCNFTLHLQIATFLQLHSLDLQSVSLEDSLHLHSSCLHFCNFTHLMLLSSYSSICFTWGFASLDVTWSFTHFTLQVFSSIPLQSVSLEVFLILLLNLFHLRLHSLSQLELYRPHRHFKFHSLFLVLLHLAPFNWSSIFL